MHFFLNYVCNSLQICYHVVSCYCFSATEKFKKQAAVKVPNFMKEFTILKQKARIHCQIQCLNTDFCNAVSLNNHDGQFTTCQLHSNLHLAGLVTTGNMEDEIYAMERGRLISSHVIKVV